jgi:Spy/CpxP family protein refolding chaperone
VDDELELTPDQKQKIADVVDDENKQIGAVRDDTSLTLEQKQQKAREIRQAGVPKIKAVLTPEQLQKLAAIQERNRQQPSNPQAAPQEPAQH